MGSLDCRSSVDIGSLQVARIAKEHWKSRTVVVSLLVFKLDAERMRKLMPSLCLQRV